jgi:TDG/mug DNA glycosylase family protein
MICESFAPVSRYDAKVLILGSLPGPRSLEMGQYYAQPRNAFWPIMGELAGAGPDVPYAQRLARLVERRVALWYVCASAHRIGALDAKIVAASVVLNDFKALFAACPNIALICFNGSTSESLYCRKVLPSLEIGRTTPTVRLPSTSPAFAAKTYAEKLALWRNALVDVLAETG